MTTAFNLHYSTSDITTIMDAGPSTAVEGSSIVASEAGSGLSIAL